jgi:hypothetical protein
MELTRRKQLADRKMELHKKKEQEIRNSVILLKDKVNSSKKQLGFSICKEIVYETVALAMIESQDRKKLTLANRENAARVANDKMYKTLAKTERIKRQLEQEALKILQLKNQLSTQAGGILASSVKETRTIPENRPDLAFKKKEEALRKREITFNDKLKQLQQLEVQASEKEKEILRRERMLQTQTRSLTPEPVVKPLNDDFKLKEKSVKLKEEELLKIEKMLKDEEDRLEAERISVSGLYDKMMAQIDNIQKQESKAERSRNDIKSQTQEYIQKKTQEEEKLLKWENSLNDSEANIEKLRAKAEKYANELNEREVRLAERMQLLDSKLKQKQEEVQHSPEAFKHHESWDSDSEISTFAENFMRRQQKWREECEEISKEKLELTRTLNEVLSELS